MSVHFVDLSRDPRAAQFQLFKGFSNPYAAVTAPVFVTGLCAWCKNRELGFFLPFLWCVTQAVNAVPELRRRIQGEAVVEYDWCPTSHTLALPNGSYCYCRLQENLPLEDFLPYARAVQERARNHPSLEDGAKAQALVFISCLPWLSYSGVVQPTPSPADSNPRIVWGKYIRQGEEMVLPVTLQVHHALADGIHIAQFFAALETALARF